MVKTPYKHIAILIGFIVLVIVAGKLLKVSPKSSSIAPTPTITQTQEVKDYVSYQGKEGKDALTLLKEQASVGQDSSGLVTSINGRQADSSKHEYWAFYVDGELAQVGPADYKTKEGNKIEWKIETY